MKEANFVVTVLVDLFIGLMFYLWQVKGVGHAGNIFIFMVWASGVIGVVGFLIPVAAAEYRQRKPVRKWFDLIASVAILAGTIWTGHVIAATLYAFALIVFRSRARRAEELVQAGEL